MAIPRRKVFPMSSSSSQFPMQHLSNSSWPSKGKQPLPQTEHLDPDDLSHDLYLAMSPKDDNQEPSNLSPDEHTADVWLHSQSSPISSNGVNSSSSSAAALQTMTPDTAPEPDFWGKLSDEATAKLIWAAQHHIGQASQDDAFSIMKAVVNHLGSQNYLTIPNQPISKKSRPHSSSKSSSKRVHASSSAGAADDAPSKRTRSSSSAGAANTNRSSSSALPSLESATKPGWVPGWQILHEQNWTNKEMATVLHEIITNQRCSVEQATAILHSVLEEEYNKQTSSSSTAASAAKPSQEELPAAESQPSTNSSASALNRSKRNMVDWLTNLNPKNKVFKKQLG
jgi:hypothetical protein